MMTVLEALGEQEGFTVPGSRPHRNNNPCDLIYCEEAIRFGATASDGHFAIFPDVATGWHAARRWLSIPAKFDKHGTLVGGYLGATIRQFLYRFTPPSDNNPTEVCLTALCARTGLTPESFLTVDNLG